LLKKNVRRLYYLCRGLFSPLIILLNLIRPSPRVYWVGMLTLGLFGFIATIVHRWAGFGMAVIGLWIAGAGLSWLFLTWGKEFEAE
jgi:hypothetical protein